MPVSSENSVSDLYCREADGDEVTSIAPSCPSDSPAEDDHSFITAMLDSERDQMPDSAKLRRVLPGIAAARRVAINWMLNVHAYYNFRPATAYLCVNYFDRFLSSHTLPQGKAWPLQLLSVACLSLAAKMEETSVPLLIDLQVIEPRFLFRPKTVQRMELLVMSNLKWRLRVVTPFDFVVYFAGKLPCFDFRCVIPRISDVILNSCRGMEFLDYPPSTVAAAAVLWATGQSIDNLETTCFHERLSKEMVETCHRLMKRRLSHLGHFKPLALKPPPPSPVGVLDATTGESCDSQKYYGCGVDSKSSKST